MFRNIDDHISYVVIKPFVVCVDLGYVPLDHSRSTHLWSFIYCMGRHKINTTTVLCPYA